VVQHRTLETCSMWRLRACEAQTAHATYLIERLLLYSQIWPTYKPVEEQVCN